MLACQETSAVPTTLKVSYQLVVLDTGARQAGDCLYHSLSHLLDA